MKKLFVLIILLANLCSSLAFAWDTHPEATMGHDSVAASLVDDDHKHPDGDLHNDDHSCHGAAHLMGIFTTISAQILDAQGDYRFSLMDALPSLYITPLLRPPIA